MNSELLTLQPQSIWKNFRSILSIPHASKKEEKLRQFIKEFGENMGLQTIDDDAGNLLIKKPATKGMESRKTIILQAHLDMVTQKNNDSNHNFDTDPIQTWIDGDWVKAKETTLGADNGLGVAAILGVLEAAPEALPHPDIEAIFTVEEEIGMNGAAGLKPGFLSGEILLNLDTEDEGQLLIGCGSGIIANVTLNYREVVVPMDYAAYKILIKDLKGGHSGLDIHLGRANSNKLLFRFLKQSFNLGALLSSVEGGTLPSAIPRETTAIISVPADLAKSFLESFSGFSNDVKREYRYTEPDMFLSMEPVAHPATAIDKDSYLKLVNALVACPTGVMRFSDAMPGLVETSGSFSMIKSNDGQIDIKFLLRSSIESAKMALCDMISAVFEPAGGKIEFNGEWPGWESNLESPILKVMKEVYKKKFNHEPEIKASHAGFECGLFAKIYPDLDMISFGPTIRFPHSPDEKIYIPSLIPFWELLAETLKNIPYR